MQTLRGQLDQARTQLQRDAALRNELAVARAERDQLRALIASLRHLLAEADTNGKEARTHRVPDDSEPSIQNGSQGSSDPPKPVPDRSDHLGEHEGLEALPHTGPAFALQTTPVSNDGVVPLEVEAKVPSSSAEKEAGEGPGLFAIPGYQILGTLSEGAMGRVYQARQTSLDRIVAVKALDPTRAKTPEYRARFLREAKLASQLSHPNFIHTIDAGEVNGHPYYIMEYVEGETIEDRLARHRVFEETTAIRIILSVAEALKYIHERGLIHRDIKPANVILTREGGVKLADLGLARPTTDAAWAASEAGRAIGTPDYISPEQVRGQIDADIRADIYSLGATLYRMVTGRVPHGGATTAEVLHKHIDQETHLVPPEQINPAVSPGLSVVIQRMLARDREERYRHPDDLILDLRGLLSEATALSGQPQGTAP
jgi:serine/threonine-protein kinase